MDAKPKLERVVLVDAKGNKIGTEEKMSAHKKALLHSAFSVMAFNKKGELLLQKRALSKYHSPGLWTNTCCSHPRENETVLMAAHRRLKEENGFDCDLKELFSFKYFAEFTNGLTEHEFDHVIIGKYDGKVTLDKNEAMDYAYKPVSEVLADIEESPQNYTAWFKIVMTHPKTIEYFKQEKLI